MVFVEGYSPTGLPKLFLGGNRPATKYAITTKSFSLGQFLSNWIWNTRRRLGKC
jgi:hypothetical protein